jgi:hypothetical protein
VDEAQAAAFAIFSHVMLARRISSRGRWRGGAALNLGDIFFLRLGKDEATA